MVSVQATASKTNPASLTDIVRAALAPLASLKLTVFLLALAVFVTWVVTLEQATIDIWELKNKHFENFFVFVPFKTFLPPNWFPNIPEFSAGFILPSGLTIIAAMLINLTTAHLLRFKLQASGTRLVLGIVVLIASALLTWAIIFNYQDADGFGGKAPIPWERMWIYLQVAVFGLGVASVYGAITAEAGRTIEKISYGLFAVIMFALLAISLILGEDAFIGDSAMRILWQLTQSTLAALAALVGCILLFKRKAGIVLLHIGIAGILLNEIFVTVTNEEHRVSFAEGQTVHHAVDLRETEFVVIDRSDPDFDDMTVLPGSILEDSVDQIDDSRLPFKIRCLDYFQNSDVLRVGPVAENKANSGIGTSYIAVEQKAAAGADADAGADKASAYVELIERTNNEPIGVYLISQAAYGQGIVDTVSIGDDSYQIGLRFKTVYTPYSLKLKDTTAEYYVGTETPKWFSSDFVINDEENGITSDQRIWMNNPLRYQDLTFYQVTYNKDADSEYSGIQVVKNKGWMIPYVCCMFVVVGLVARFQQTLSSHLSNSSRKKSSSNLVASEDEQTSFIAAWGPTILILGVFGLYIGSQFARSVSPKLTKTKGSEIRLDLLGQLPVTYGGRVQPLDSYARNIARQLGNRETVVDEFGKKQPAIKWLADMMFDAPLSEEYEVLRIEDLNVQNALGLNYRKGMKYKFSEIREANKKLVELLIEADKKPSDQRSVLEIRLNEVFSKSRLMMGVQTAIYGTDGRYEDDDLLGRLEVAANLARSKTSMPFAMPTNDPDEPWMPLSIVKERLWLQKLMAKTNSDSIEELADYLLTTEIAKLKPELAKEKIISELMQYEEIVEGLSEKFELEDSKELAEVLSRNWHMVPEKLYADEMKSAAAFVDSRLRDWRLGKERIVVEMIETIKGSKTNTLKIDQQVVENLSGLKEAYVNGDAAAFNTSLEKHLTSVATIQPDGWNKTSQKAEIAYNYFAPFHAATFLYLMGFVVTLLSWIGLRRPMNRAAFSVICFALLIHLGGVVARVVISGRPPITNLYSSFVVVAAGCVIILLLIEYSTKLGLGNLLAGACGFMSLLYAWTLSIGQGDTFTVLRAVLDTQFWLTTHVIIINLGYSATLVAGLTGVALLVCMFFNRNFDKQSRKTFTNIIYGTACFALLFSFFGTVLGGLWADDSWGRFWGWDPKENGALMIVLWNAVILHARWSGLVRERGIAALAAFGNVIVIWSWEGVNQLGVGLHAYADSGGAAAAGSIFMEPMFYLKMFVVFHVLIAAMAMILPRHFYRSFANEALPKTV